MKIKRVVKPGDPGTKKLLNTYGDNLICVRYRYDAENNRMYKTVELIIENLPWQQNTRKIRKDKIVDLCIRIEEVEMRNRVKLAGGKWNRNKQVWQLLYETAQQLGLTDRIVCDK